MASPNNTRSANALLDRLRQTPLRRGSIPKGRMRLKHEMSSAVEAEGVPAALAQRIAFQLVFKFTDAELGDRDVWTALGRQLQQETSRLRTYVGLVDRQIVTALLKVSASQVEEFMEELRTADRAIARTILNAALEAAEPLAAGRRYLAAYRDVTRQLETIDPTVARTLANATFTTGAPGKKAVELLERFAALMRRFDAEPDFARIVSKATWRAVNPPEAVEAFVGQYNAVMVGLVSSGVETHVARMLAGLSGFRGPFGQRRHSP